jgi:Mrp family chromosome partitioning ATPase
MMDPALLRTQIGGTPAGLLGSAGAAKTLAVPMEQAPNTQPIDPKAVTEPAGVVPPGAMGGTQRIVDQAPGTLRGGASATTEPPPQAAAKPRSDPARGQPGGRPSSNPPRVPRPSSDPPSGRNPALAGSNRPSKIPLPGSPRVAEVFSTDPVLPRPPPLGIELAGTPETRRFGSVEYSETELPKTISPPPPPPSRPPREYLPDTKYSFVDRGRSSRAPAPTPGHSLPQDANRAGRRSDAPRTYEEPQRARQPPAWAQNRVSERPPPVVERAESDLRGQSRPPPVVEAEVVQRPNASAAPPAAESITARSVPPGWSLKPSLKVENGNGVLGGLRDQIFEYARRAPCVIGVTGEYNSLEMKSMLASRLAVLLSEDGRVRVLLLEANFDFPQVHRVVAVDMPPGLGFSQQLRARLRSGVRKQWTVISCTDRLHVLAEGLVRSPGVLLSQEFADAVAELRTNYDVIVIDGPIAGLGIETKPLDAVTDGIAIAAGPGSVLRETLERGMKWFGQKKLFVAVPADGSPS